MVREEKGGAEFLTMRDDSVGYETLRLAKSTEITLEMLANLMDQDAENVNAHDFVASHRGLAAFLFKEIGRKKATELFLKLVNFRGLHGMTDVCGCVENLKEHEIELGVQLEDWSDWKLG